MARRTTAVALALAVVGAGAAACGESAPAPRTQTKPAYIAAVDAVCAQGRRRPPEREPSNVREQVEEFASTAELMTDMVTRIEAVPPPPSDAAKLREGFLGPHRRFAERMTLLARDARAAVRAGDDGRAASVLRRAEERGPEEGKALAFAETYGFRACAGR
ncbi:hypothetical protein GCM10009678_85730 [Actinomadura kijaniata]|uniref:Lipoprotein n=1 Tax=Actinomadura namibiensis TaxID=182080 RepID=A0A7W3M0E7_ACTNM|nr:hypothetical protein [Actinomadura namibiensis]MBA8957680.1 hypothetical protein [Actinomadura namibiensis]